MTDRDVLKRASDALRESTEPSAEELLELRQRVLGSRVVPLSRASKRKTLRWVLPLAAAFIAGSALAATPGAWQGMLHSVERFLDIERLGPAHEAAAKPRLDKRKRTVPAPPPLPSAGMVAEEPAVPVEALGAVAEPVEAHGARGVEVEGDAPVVAAAPRVPGRVRREGAGTSGTSTEATTTTTTATSAATSAETRGARGTSRELSLYRSAHELHFGAKRYDEALRAWESYLALPSPTFALEARYNRALCLLRLGHYEEARAALRPFAEGRVLGGYRRVEAGRLIEALDKRR